MKKIGVILLSIIVSLGAACFDVSAQTTVVAPQPKKTKEKTQGGTSNNKKRKRTTTTTGGTTGGSGTTTSSNSGSSSASTKKAMEEKYRAVYEAAYQDCNDHDDKARSERGYQTMRDLAEAGYPRAFAYGALGFKNIGDYDKMAYYGKRAIEEMDDKWIAWHLAQYYDKQEDYENALKYYLVASNVGWWKGQCWYEIGCMYELGMGTEKDLDKAREAYKNAFMLGDKYSDYTKKAKASYERLGGGSMYDPEKFGKTKVDPRRLLGMSEYDLLREADDYLDGNVGKPKNPYMAFAYYQFGAEQGYPKAMLKLSSMYKADEYGIKDLDMAQALIDAAVATYEERARKGDPEAMLELGSMFKNGYYGVTRDEQKARDYYLRGAQAGQMYCMRYYAEYLIRDGNTSEGFKYMLQAAEKGDGMAQYEVGKMYRDGFGVATDIDKARYWLEKASKNHYVSASDAERDLKRLSK